MLFLSGVKHLVAQTALQALAGPVSSLSVSKQQQLEHGSLLQHGIFTCLGAWLAAGAEAPAADLTCGINVHTAQENYKSAGSLFQCAGTQGTLAEL